MDPRLRDRAAAYYDLDPPPFGDVAFYRRRLPSADAAVLELGCGTGRVTLPLAATCGHVDGVDHADAMLAICRRKLAARAELEDRLTLQTGDITDLDLGRTFDLVIAPYRVMQNLDSDAEVAGFYRTIRRHLSADGRAIVNAFHPLSDRDELRATWVSRGETPTRKGILDGDRVVVYDRRVRMDRERLVLYPEVVYRRYRGDSDELVDEVVLPLVMRCFYPDDLLRLAGEHGFRVVASWGGYAGERFGEGSELVVEMALA